ncbi:MAG: ABC transporter permease [Lentisphaerae bacterium]|nr:ABC transporter permease [Lentisphaerota bacterium]
MIPLVKDLTEHGDLIWNLVARDLKVRYRGSILGFLWTILNPLFMAVIYIVFLRLLAGGGIAIRYEDIIIGVFAWQFTVQCVTAGLNCVTGNTALVKKVYFPRIILPLSVCVSAFVNFLLMLVVQWALLAILLMMKGAFLSSATLLVPVLSLYHLLFNLSLALLVAAANVYFRDAQHIVNLLLSAWFFMSPVMYPLSFVESIARAHPWIGQLYLLNPMTVIITGYRAAQVPLVAFPWTCSSLVGLLIPLALAFCAYTVFQRAQRYFADNL